MNDGGIQLIYICMSKAYTHRAHKIVQLATELINFLIVAFYL